MLGKDKAVEMIDAAIEQQREYETSGDGLDNYSVCFEDSHMKPGAGLIVARAISAAKLESDNVHDFRDYMDIVHNAVESDYPAEMIKHVLDKLFWCTDVVFSPGIFMTQQDQCITLDSVTMGEIEIPLMDNTTDRPLFREYYNSNGNEYISDNGYAYSNIDGSACLVFNLENLETLLDDYQEA